MSIGTFSYPMPVNEPVLSYAPNSPERKRLKEVLAELKKQEILQVVSDPKDAQFILEYKQLSETGSFGAAGATYRQRSEMQAYFYKGKQKIVAWSATEEYNQASGISLEKPNETVLTRKFLKALKKK